MLHEILLSLSGRPSPLLHATSSSTETDGGALNIQPAVPHSKLLSPPERALLASLAHLSAQHVRLFTSIAEITATHASSICRAVAAAIETIHLAAFQNKILEVESTILHRDAALVGAHGIVPLTAVVDEFSGWTRRMEWLWELVQFVEGRGKGGATTCTGAALIDRLRAELQTGYVDIEDVARSLVKVAEAAWLKQASAWILYGRLPSFGSNDFFVQKTDDGEEGYICSQELLPSFVHQSTASSMLFIGRSLHHIRIKGISGSGLHGASHLSSQLKELSSLTYPLDPATFSRNIDRIRQFLSKTILQRLLPLGKVLEILHLLRDFFLLGRGEFAMALTQQADDCIRNRWRRADKLAYEKQEGIRTFAVKEGEVIAVMGKTWAALGSMQGQHAEEDEGLELARDLLLLKLPKSKEAAPAMPTVSKGGRHPITSTPFRNLLFVVPVDLTLRDIQAPLDLFLTHSDLQTYTRINSYLLSIRRAHIRLTDLWKISSLRRHFPSPPQAPHGNTRAGTEKTRLLRERHTSRANVLRCAWATASAAVFFLAETEAYLQIEVVGELWDGFRQWLTQGNSFNTAELEKNFNTTNPDEDIWLAAAEPSDSSQSQRHPKQQTAPPTHSLHDPQTLVAAHRLYLHTLTRHLLLTTSSFTELLYSLLVSIDHLVALIHRLHAIWTSTDLEADLGVIDAFIDLASEERDVRRELAGVEIKVRKGIESIVGELRRLEFSSALMGEGENVDVVEENGYLPRRVGGADRLLMKLDFGSWFGVTRSGLDDETLLF